jgi:SAM-dependent methyltransferase
LTIEQRQIAIIGLDAPNRRPKEVIMSVATIDQEALDTLLGQVVVEAGATLNAALVGIGDRLGLYRALRDHGAQTPAEVAGRTSTSEPYVREWLNAQAAGGFVDFDPATRRYSLSPAQAALLADPDSPAFVPGLFQLVLAAARDASLVESRFRTGDGLGWHEHHHDLFEGTERFFRAGYNAHLVAEWIPALEGVDAKLRAGALVADIGCGHGASTVLLAQAYPQSTFVGFDYHDASIATAQTRARDAGVADRVTFTVASSTTYPGAGYDLVACFDCLHDMGDPVGAARHVRESLAADGTWMIVEPRAGDQVEENLHPLGRLFYGASTLICTPASLDQPGRAALGTQAGEAQIRRVVTDAGFARFRRAAETPTNLVFEARA